MPHFALPSKFNSACCCFYLLLSIITHHSSYAFSSILPSKEARQCHSSPPFGLNSASSIPLASTSTPKNNHPITSTLLYSTTTATNNNTPNSSTASVVPLLLSSTLIDSAIDVLEEQHFRRPDTPLDSILRKYIKQQQQDKYSYDAEEKDALRKLILGVARNQYKIDFHLSLIGVECTPEHRAVAHVAAMGTVMGGISPRKQKHPHHRLVSNLMKSYEWLKKFNDDFTNTSSTMDLQTRLECPDWAWPGLNEAFPTTDELTVQLRSLLDAPPLDLRVNTLKCMEGREEALLAIQSSSSDVGVHATITPYSPLGIRLPKRVPLETIPGLLDGIVEPQDEGSQLVASLLDAQPGETIADYCSGTGGKTLAIAAQMQNKGRLYALDVGEDRLERGRPRCSKAGVSNVQRQVVQSDMSRKDKWCKRRNRKFDRVLVDAPCSGVVSWRRKPDARRTWGGVGYNTSDKGAERLKELLPLQQQILRRAARLVKPGGRLVYVTCSLLPEENEHQIEEFLKCNDEGGASEWKVDTPMDFVVPFEAGNGRYLRLTPAQHGTDGFFAAVLRRDEEE